MIFPVRGGNVDVRPHRHVVHHVRDGEGDAYIINASLGEVCADPGGASIHEGVDRRHAGGGEEAPEEGAVAVLDVRVLLANALGRHRTNSGVGIDADDDGRSWGARARSEDSVAESLPENDFAARIRPIVRRVGGEGDHQRAGTPSRTQKGLYLDESRRMRQDRPRLRAEGVVQPNLHPIVACPVCCSGEDIVEEAVDALRLPVAPLLDAHEHDPASVKLHLERLQSPRAGLLQPGVSRP